MKTYLLSLTFWISSLFYCSAEEGEYHLFILSGQSNMQGMNPNVGLMPEAKKLFGNTQVKFIKIAKGGRPIRLWVDEWNSIAEKHSLKARIEKTEFYKPILNEFSKVVEQFDQPKSITFCWMQGERMPKKILVLPTKIL